MKKTLLSLSLIFAIATTRCMENKNIFLKTIVQQIKNNYKQQTPGSYNLPNDNAAQKQFDMILSLLNPEEKEALNTISVTDNDFTLYEAACMQGWPDTLKSLNDQKFSIVDWSNFYKNAAQANNKITSFFVNGYSNSRALAYAQLRTLTQTDTLLNHKNKSLYIASLIGLTLRISSYYQDQSIIDIKELIEKNQITANDLNSLYNIAIEPDYKLNLLGASVAYADNTPKKFTQYLLNTLEMDPHKPIQNNNVSMQDVLNSMNPIYTKSQLTALKALIQAQENNN